MQKETTEVVGQGVKVALDSGIIGWLGTIIAAVFAWLLNRYHRSIGHRISSASAAAAAAAAAAALVEDRRREDTTDLHRKLDAHISRDVDIHERLLTAITEQTRTLGSIHASLERELGSRPTREEVREMMQRRA
jgi:biopolymer transport protein ExbB/TolQ